MISIPAIKEYIMKKIERYPQAKDAMILDTYDIITDSSALNFIFDKIHRPRIYTSGTQPDYYTITYQRYVKNSKHGKDINPTEQLTSEDIETAKVLVKKYLLDKYGVADVKDVVLYEFFRKFYRGELPLTATWGQYLNSL